VAGGRGVGHLGRDLIQPAITDRRERGAGANGWVGQKFIVRSGVPSYMEGVFVDDVYIFEAQCYPDCCNLYVIFRPTRNCNLTSTTLLVHAMSLLVKKMKQGSSYVLYWPIVRAKGPPTEQESLPPAKLKGKHMPRSPATNIPHILCCPEEPKTAWEYYNEGTYAARSRYIV
jgi:hypothetical protein